MPNQLSKLYELDVVGELFQTAVNQNLLAIQSIGGDRIHFSVVDLETGQLICQHAADNLNARFTLIDVQSDYLVLQKFENTKNPDSISHWKYDWIASELSPLESTTEESELIIPSMIPDGSEAFGTIKEFLNLPTVLNCEYLEQNGFVLICYYLQKNDTYSRHLWVFNDGLVKLEMTLDEKLKGFAPGGFFTHQNRLIFAREKNNVHVYKI